MLKDTSGCEACPVGSYGSETPSNTLPDPCRNCTNAMPGTYWVRAGSNLSTATDNWCPLAKCDNACNITHGG